MRAAVSILLALHLLHLPVPFPDLDGECRGVPIEGLADANAWHVVLLGVRPNDDVDRGPIRPTDPRPDDDPSQSPFCDHAAVASNPHVATVGGAWVFEVCVSAEIDVRHMSGNCLSWLEIRGNRRPLSPRDSVLRI